LRKRESSKEAKLGDIASGLLKLFINENAKGLFIDDPQSMSETLFLM